MFKEYGTRLYNEFTLDSPVYHIMYNYIPFTITRNMWYVLDNNAEPLYHVVVPGKLEEEFKTNSIFKISELYKW